MAMVVAFLLEAGLFVDVTVLIIVLTPIFLPLILDLGGDPVHFGVVFIVAATPDVQEGAAQRACLPVGSRDYRLAA